MSGAKYLRLFLSNRVGVSNRGWGWISVMHHHDYDYDKSLAHQSAVTSGATSAREHMRHPTIWLLHIDGSHWHGPCSPPAQL